MRKILHIGNILNNGYLHCLYLRGKGVEADSLNVDYKHVQGQPEWAEVYIDKPVGDEFNPDWSLVDLRGYKRPEWFFDIALKDLPELGSHLANGGAGEIATVIENQYTPPATPSKIRRAISQGLTSIGLDSLLRYRRRKRVEFQAALMAGGSDAAKRLAETMVNEFRKTYPDWGKKLSVLDVYDHLPRATAHGHVIRNYNLIQAYSLDPINVMLGNPGQPFIAYEHGTMREFPFEDSSRGRLYALSVKKAEKLIITNADCNRAADRLGLKNYVFIPHIIDERFMRPFESPFKRMLKEEHGCDFIFVAPARHHWKNCPPGLENSWFKRNDIMIRALGKLFSSRPKLKALVIFFEWGQEVELSKELIRECGFADKTLWKPICSKPAMQEYYNAADVVLDQFNDGIGTFGAVAPEGMACGKPVLINYKEDLHRWCYPVLPPLINTKDEDAIAMALGGLVDNPDYLARKGEEGRKWFLEHHSSSLVISRMVDVYMEIAEKYGWAWKYPRQGGL